MNGPELLCDYGPGFPADPARFLEPYVTARKRNGLGQRLQKPCLTIAVRSRYKIIKRQEQLSLYPLWQEIMSDE